MKQNISVVFLMCCAFMFYGCATTTASVHLKPPGNKKPFKEVVSAKKLFMMQPFISAVTTNTEEPVSLETCGATSLANLLENHVRKVCQDTGSAKITFQKDIAQEGPAQEALKSIADKSRVLMSYYRNKEELMPSFQTIAKATGAEIIGAYSIAVKVGGSGGWNPNTGQIWQGTSSTTIKAVLISPTTGKVLWGNEIFVRTLASDKQCVEAAEMLFTDAKREETSNE